MRDWLKNKYPSGWLGYSPWWLLCHPWEAVPEIGRRICWAWQRVFRGWDDRVTWSIDGYLNEHMPTWLRVLRDEGTGFPVCMYDQADWLRIVEGANPEGSTERAAGRWRYILSRMIAGFEAGQKLDQGEWHDENERQQLQAQLDEALKLFAEYYQALWD